SSGGSPASCSSQGKGGGNEMQGPFAWSPDKRQIEESNLSTFLSLHGLRNYDELVERADDDPTWFWDAVFKFHNIQFVKEYRTIVEYPNGAELPEWCLGGTTNLVLNCIDRHADSEVWDKTAIVAISEDGSERKMTYRELDHEIQA